MYEKALPLTHSIFTWDVAITLFVHEYIHLNAITDMILVYIQWFGPLAPDGDPEPPNKHTTSYRSTFALASPLGDTNTLALVNSTITIGTWIALPTPRAYWTVDRGSNSLSNYRAFDHITSET